MAKRTVEKEYAVVGTWEDTNITLSVLENYVPRYFKGATKMYYSKFFALDNTIFRISLKIGFSYYRWS